MAEAVSTLVKQSARAILRHLRDNPEGASKDELVRSVGVSKPSLQRALTWLRDECDSPVEFERGAGVWRLRDPHFSLPLSDPEAEDLAAVMFASALLAPLADEEITERLRRLAEQMDGEIRARDAAAPDAPGTRPGALVATVTSAATVDPNISAALLSAAGRRVVAISYVSPWAAAPERTRQIVEPWQMRLHDGAYYLRAWSRAHDAPRTFAVAHIEAVIPLDGDVPRAPLPPAEAIWGDADPAFGIDHDRPDTATVRVRGATARWLHRVRWHPAQHDEWLEANELLERRLPYRSCRELARRLLSLGSAVVAIEPPALRDEVRAHVESMGKQLTDVDESD